MDEIENSRDKSKVREIGADRPDSAELEKNIVAPKEDRTVSVEIELPENDSTDEAEVKNILRSDDDVVSSGLLKKVSKDTSPIKKNDVAATVAKKIISFTWLLFVSLLIAAAVWSYVLSIDSNEYVKSFELPVSVGNQTVADGYKIYTDGEIYATVTIAGKRSEIYDITSETVKNYIELYIDTADIAGTGNTTVAINSKNSAKDSVLSVRSIEPASVNVFADIEATKTVKIENKLTYVLNLPLYEECSADFVFDKDEVTITGPRSLLDGISKASITADIGSISESRNIDRIPVILMQESGETVKNSYITMESSTVSGKVIITTQRKLAVNAVYPDMPDGLLLKAYPSEIFFEGDPKVLDTLKDGLTVNISEYVKKSDITAGTEVNVALSDITLPEGVSIIDKTLTVIKAVFSNAE